MSFVHTVEALEARVGARSLATLLKSIDVLDEHLQALISRSPFAVLGYADPDGTARALGLGGTAGFAEVLDERRLRLPLRAPVQFHASIGGALLFFIPGLCETARVNGRLTLEGGAVVMHVEEAFLHCAKALIRSSLWKSPGPGLTQGTVEEFLARSPFVVLTSWDAQGRADASPKGDPVGFLRQTAASRVAIPDRPGNRRTDTFHNVLEQPKLALLGLLPGENRVLELSGTARLTDAPELLASMAVERKTPAIALELEITRAEVVTSQALTEAQLWDPSRHVPLEQLPRMAMVFTDHVKRNKQRGFAATLLRTLASKRLMEIGLEHDYRKNLY